MLSIDALFCHVDDFCQQFEPQWQRTLLSYGLTTRQRKRSLCLSEIMTILIAFHYDKLLSRKRSIIETIIDQLKNISQIEHSRHRSPVNFCVNVLCGLIAYCHQPKKPSLQMDWVLKVLGVRLPVSMIEEINQVPNKSDWLKNE